MTSTLITIIIIIINQLVDNQTNKTKQTNTHKHTNNKHTYTHKQTHNKQTKKQLNVIITLR